MFCASDTPPGKVEVLLTPLDCYWCKTVSKIWFSVESASATTVCVYTEMRYVDEYI